MFENIEIEQLMEIDVRDSIIDIREPNELKGGSIKGAKNIPMNILLMDPENYLNKSSTYYIICHSGGRSSKTCQLLHRKGFDVVNVLGGMMAFMNSRYA